MTALFADRLTTVAIGLVVASLALRDVSAWAVAVPMCGAAAVLWMPSTDERASVRSWLACTGVGLAAFLAVRLGGQSIVVPLTAWGVLAGVLAGVAEEAIFRKALYARLQRYGALVAVLGAAVLFGAVHVPMYGWHVLPLDIAAGVVFGWQRWASGTWTVPAATHAIVNLTA